MCGSLRPSLTASCGIQALRTAVEKKIEHVQSPLELKEAVPPAREETT
jgi:hypothetical protein